MEYGCITGRNHMFWRTADNRKLKLTKMTDQHLLNIYNSWSTNDASRNIDCIRAELKLRQILPKNSYSLKSLDELQAEVSLLSQKLTRLENMIYV